jgi:HEAT repeat protein
VARAIHDVVAHGESVVLVLRSLLDDAESRVVQNAAKALALLGDDKALHLLVDKFLDEQGVPEWVAQLGIRGAHALLTMRDDSDNDIAIAVLAPYTSTIEPELLRIAAANEDASWSVVNLLGYCGTEEAFAALTAMLQDRKKGDTTRADVAMVLGRAGYDGAADLLRTVLQDESERPTVRKACMKELERLRRERAPASRRSMS